MNSMAFPTPRLLVDNRASAQLRLPRFLKDRRAIEASEFAVLAAAIIAVVYGAFRLLGGNISALVTQVANFIQ